MINPYIFREYDIRGVVDQDLTDEVVEQIGKGFSTYITEQGAKSVSVGGDVRLSTNRFLKHLIKGLTSSGIDVINIGQVPTPVQYFSMHELNVDAGIMITGSHNPPEFNGFKLSLFNAPVFGTEIQKIKEIINSNKFITGSGTTKELDLKEKYKNYLKNNINIKKQLKVVIDSG
ncbi:MAG: phosphomannomutase, partial [Calditrichia bacterium]|nr:phosphomannomutase [Calditrichia bacterium]